MSLKTFERIPERVRAFQVTQGHIDGSEALPDERFVGVPTDHCTAFIIEGPSQGNGLNNRHLVSVGKWIVFGDDGYWFIMSDADFRAKYRATSDSESESTDE